MLAAGFYRTLVKRTFILVLVLLFIALPLLEPSYAHKKRRRSRRAVRHPYKSALLIDADSGQVLSAYRPRKRILPASVVKMMTALIVMEHIQDKKNHLSEIVRISRAAARVNGQQVYLRRGETFRLRDLMQAMLISSANDAAYAVAEHVGGSASRFVRMMNQRARQLGMTDSRFVNPNGLPPRGRRPANIMSARDAGILARKLVKFPRILSWTSTRTAPFRGHRHALVNTNRLLRSYPGMDGLKTGYYRRAGFNLVATAKRRNLRLIGIVFGARNSARRFRAARNLLTWGFSHHKWAPRREDHRASLDSRLQIPVPLRFTLPDGSPWNPSRPATTLKTTTMRETGQEAETTTH